MRKLKFILSALLILSILASSTAFASEIQSTSQGTSAIYRNGEYYYELTPQGTVKLLLYTGDLIDIVIPTTIDGYPVTAIGDLAFMGTQIRTLEIHKGISSIGTEAFSNCNNLSSVQIFCSSPNTKFGSGVFRNCVNLETVTFSNGPRTIGDHMFYNCTLLTTATIPATITSIPTGAFAYCKNLRAMYLAYSPIKIIEPYAFYHTGPIDIYLSYELEEIRDKSFAEIMGLRIFGISNPYNYVTPIIYEDAFIDTSIVYNDWYHKIPNQPTQPGEFSPPPTEPSTTSPTMPSDPTEPPVVTPTEPTIPVVPENSDPTDSPGASATPDETEVTEPYVTDPMSTNPAATAPPPTDYMPGENYIVDSNTYKVYLNEKDQSQKAQSYKEGLLANLVAVAWDVRKAGDANLDNVVNIKDSTMVQKYVARLIDDNTPGFNFKNADVYANGVLNIRDATMIQKKVAHIIRDFY